jgi:NAD(P) transhydrogenase subunit alpha
MQTFVRASIAVSLLLISIAILMSARPAAAEQTSQQAAVAEVNSESVKAFQSTNSTPSEAASTTSTSGALSEVGRGARIVASFTVFLLSVFVGFEVINKVPPTLHTPLMSGSNAISGITIIGAVLTAGSAASGLGAFLGMLAVILAIINVVGGFVVTHRMLKMFKKR